jgi:hypothetical protein
VSTGFVNTIFIPHLNAFSIYLSSEWPVTAHIIGCGSPYM